MKRTWIFLLVLVTILAGCGVYYFQRSGTEPPYEEETATYQGNIEIYTLKIEYEGMSELPKGRQNRRKIEVDLKTGEMTACLLNENIKTKHTVKNTRRVTDYVKKNLLLIEGENEISKPVTLWNKKGKNSQRKCLIKLYTSKGWITIKCYDDYPDYWEGMIDLICEESKATRWILDIPD